MLRPPTRLMRRVELQGAFADLLRAKQPSTQSTLAHQPQLPAGMKWLVSPREALEGRAGDTTTMRIAFDRWLFWRLLWGATLPTKASLVRCGQRLRALALWQLAIRAHQQGKPLPLKSGKSARDVPAAAVSQHTYDRLLKAAAQVGKRAVRVASATTTRDAYDGTDGSDNQDNQDQNDTGDPSALDDMLSFWETWGAVDAATLANIVNPNLLRSLLDDNAFTVAGQSLSFDDVFANLSAQGYSDLDIAGLIDAVAATFTQYNDLSPDGTLASVLDASWNAQAAQWAGQDMFSNAGIGGVFDLRNPYFYDYLRNQSGSLVFGMIDFTQRSLAEDLWTALGGAGGPGLYNMQGLANFIHDRYWIELTDSTKFDAAYRAYMIAVTETARAESFGNFVSLYQTGARQKIWIVNAGACQICLGNAEAGPVDLLESFPSGELMPPAHPICRCSASAAIPTSFNPNDWTPRNPDDLASLLFSTTGAAWPDVDLSDLADDTELAAQAQVTRRRQPHAVPHAVPLATTTLRTLGDRMTALVRSEADRWLREAHVRLPAHEAELRTLAKRLRTPDELPDAREADEQCLHRLREGLAEVLRSLAPMISMIPGGTDSKG